jgi:hypothetical protein
MIEPAIQTDKATSVGISDLLDALASEQAKAHDLMKGCAERGKYDHAYGWQCYASAMAQAAEIAMRLSKKSASNSYSTT